MSDELLDEPNKADIDAVAEAMRAIAPATREPDWSALAANIGRAVDDEARRMRRRRRLIMGGVVVAAAAVAAMLVWPRGQGHRPVPSLEGSSYDDPVRDSPDEIRRAKLEDAFDELSQAIDTLGEDADEAIEVPDDFGSLTIDDNLAAEAAWIDDGLDDAVDDLDNRLLPDGAWIDDLSDEDLERVVEILDGEAG